jgi:sulfate adenylyltransferase
MTLVEFQDQSDGFSSRGTAALATVAPAAHGGVLKNLYVTPERAAALKRERGILPSWDLTPRQLCDLELLANGAFSPLEGFLDRADYERVLREQRLGNGVLWPMPITLDVSEKFGAELRRGQWVELRDAEGVPLAWLEVGDVWAPDRTQEAQSVYGTLDTAHPGVRVLLEQSGPVYVGGRIHAIEPPAHYDFRHLRSTPAQVRAHFEKLGHRRVVAFQTRNPMHRAHQELTVRAAHEADAHLLIHPVVGLTKPGDIDHYTRVRCYERLLDRYPAQSATLSLLPLAMRMAGPREALWHAIIRRNYGCTHFIVGRDHAGPGKDSRGRDFYGPYDAQELVARHQTEIGIRMVPFRNMVYVAERETYVPENEVVPGERVLDISGSELRRRLREGASIPAWFTYPELAEELQRTHPPRLQQGFTVFFTGLSGAGKSTIANALRVKLLEAGGRPVTLLDGDLVRKNLSSELGFSRAHRDLNIRRIGFVASEITRHGGIAICAPIAPYAATRRAVRHEIEPLGGFVEVYVATPLETCEERDRKGLYAKARAGVIPEFTGISDPYETPSAAEVVIDTRGVTPDEAAQTILLKLQRLGYVA